MKAVIHKPLDPIWLKAAVIGSSWASIEIILGSFLHNLKIPLSGTILSFISVYLLITFLQIWKENGLVIRAGLVCALMKSISPSAIIIGPMIGIISEALFLELFIFLLGKNIVGYITGGAFAVLSTLLHKIMSLIILYGLNFIKILSDLYYFSVKQIHLNNLDPVLVILIISSIYIFAGISAAVAGFITGNKYLKRKKANPDRETFKLHSNNQLFSETTKQKYSVFYLLLNLGAITISLLIINWDFSLAIIFPLLYITLCIYHYKSSLNRFRKFSVWLQFAIITFAAAFLWSGFSENNFFTINGLVVGLKMIARAIILIIGFATISIELKNPLIKSVLYNKGFSNLYQSLTLAFSALPTIISSLPNPKKVFKESHSFFSNIFSQAEMLLPVFEKDHLLRSPVIIITGDRNQGKTTFVKTLIEKLLQHDIKISGFLSLGKNKNGIRSSFNILDLQTSQQTELCTSDHHESWLHFGKYYFNPKGVSLGVEILNTKNLADKQLVIIDEIGPIELNDQGWSKAVDSICQTSSILQLWVIRQSLVDKVIKKWNTGNVYIFNISEDNISDVENRIVSLSAPSSQC